MSWICLPCICDSLLKYTLWVQFPLEKTCKQTLDLFITHGFPPLDENPVFELVNSLASWQLQNDFWLPGIH